jgi:thymidylate synthase
MRIYQDASEMYEEIRRDLKEMGIKVHTVSMQNQLIEFERDFETTELQNYAYMLLNAESKEIAQFLPVDRDWADAEFEERITYVNNPGEAWKIRRDVWEPLLVNGTMDYTYGERFEMANNLSNVIRTLKGDPYSRRLWLGVWCPKLDSPAIDQLIRVPCSIGYQFQFRGGKLHIHYVMRSCDFGEHFSNDVYLAVKLLEYVAREAGMEPGNFTHTMFSLHVYNKDVSEVF